MNVRIHRMKISDVERIAPLMNHYREFYAQTSDLKKAHEWLHDCCVNEKSVVFYAELEEQIAGFAQLFPMLSSVRCANTWVLNDLFVEPFARRHGVGKGLLKTAEDFAREDNAAYITLETMRSNTQAQALYQTAGWQAEQTQWFSVSFK